MAQFYQSSKLRITRLPQTVFLYDRYAWESDSACELLVSNNFAWPYFERLQKKPNKLNSNKLIFLFEIIWINYV